MARAVGRTDVPGTRFIHATAMIAYLTPPYLTAIAFVYLFSPNAGLVNRFLRDGLGLGQLTWSVDSMAGLVLLRSLIGWIDLRTLVMTKGTGDDKRHTV